MLTKDFDFALDLGKLSQTEEDLEAIVKARAPREADGVATDDAERFHGGAQGQELHQWEGGPPDVVGELYRGAFEKEMGEITDLNYNRLGWGDEEMVLVSKVIASGAMAQLKALYLAENQIGDEGMKSFSTALASGVMAQLEILVLGGNQIGDEGMKSFATTLATHKHSSGV
jgi:hypothetical protein